MPKNNMKDTEYYRSGNHAKNANTASLLGAEVVKRQRDDRILEYNKSPNCCAECNSALAYKIRKNKFCSRSCAAIFNNREKYNSGWLLSEEQKGKISQALIGKPHKINQALTSKSHKKTNKPRKQYLLDCKICHKKQYVTGEFKHRKTCGDADCKIQACVGKRTYQNGSRKPTYFFNPFENKQVLLDSSWEVRVAQLLIERNIRWIRPPFIKWLDSTNTTRRYFPDFYLIDYDLYLDPKNPYCMKKDSEKIKVISLQVNLAVGDVSYIIQVIENLESRWQNESCHSDHFCRSSSEDRAQ